MQMKKIFASILSLVVVLHCSAQNTSQWNGKKSAVVLTYDDGLNIDFVAARGVRSEMLPIEKVDLYNLPCYMINGQSGEELIAMVKKAMAENKLLVFLFHGVGGEHGLNVSLEAHRQLLQFLKQNEKDIWVAPMIDVAGYIKDYQSKKKI